MGKRAARWARRPISDIAAEMTARDEIVCDEGVRAFCPCHAGWEVFEQNVQVVFRHLRAGSRIVRAHALHVFDDAMRMQMAEELKYYVEDGEPKIGEKRACARYRSMQDRLEARRARRIKRHKGHRASCSTRSVELILARRFNAGVHSTCDPSSRSDD